MRIAKVLKCFNGIITACAQKGRLMRIKNPIYKTVVFLNTKRASSSSIKTLSWHDHIHYISNRFSKSVNMIAKRKPPVTSQSLRSIYYTFVYPCLTYGCVLWGNNYEAPLSKLVRLQNKAIRIINNVPLRDHITPRYANLGLIKLPDIDKLNTCQLIYDHLIDGKPSRYTISLVSEQHNYATLQYLNPGFSRIYIRKYCPTVIGCYFWNDLSSSYT